MRIVGNRLVAAQRSLKHLPRRYLTIYRSPFVYASSTSLVTYPSPSSASSLDQDPFYTMFIN